MKGLDLTPLSIQEEVEKALPLQRHHVLESFKNIPVKWNVRFRDVYGLPDENGNLKLMTKPMDGTFGLTIRIPSNVNDYPELSRLEPDSILQVKGRIEAVEDAWSINLKDCELVFPGIEREITSEALEGTSTVIHHAEQVHFGPGNNIKSQHISNKTKDGTFWSTLPEQLIIGVLVAVVLAVAAHLANIIQ